MINCIESSGEVNEKSSTELVFLSREKTMLSMTETAAVIVL